MFDKVPLHSLIQGFFAANFLHNSFYDSKVLRATHH